MQEGHCPTNTLTRAFTSPPDTITTVDDVVRALDSLADRTDDDYGTGENFRNAARVVNVLGASAVGRLRDMAEQRASFTPAARAVYNYAAALLADAYEAHTPATGARKRGAGD